MSGFGTKVRSQLQKQVLSLYKELLKSAKGKPGFSDAIQVQVLRVKKAISIRTYYIVFPLKYFWVSKLNIFNVVSA